MVSENVNVCFFGTVTEAYICIYVKRYFYTSVFFFVFLHLVLTVYTVFDFKTELNTMCTGKIRQVSAADQLCIVQKSVGLI